ncbi:RNA-directed DNA polymerase, eukaryota [Tanacetum coccineum]
MSQPANDAFSQHLSDDEASNHEDASDTGAAPKQQQQEHMRRFHGMDDAKEIWEAIRTRFGGNANSKKMQKAVFKQQFEAFTISSSEGLEKGYDRFQQLLSQHVLSGNAIRTKPDVDTLSIDDLYNNLRVFEQEIQGASKTFSSAQNVAFVSQSKSSTNKVKSGFTGAYSTCTPSTSSTNIPEKEALAGFADEKLECFNCHNTGHFARECTTNGTHDGKKKRDSFYQHQEAGKQEKNQMGLLTMDDGIVNWGELLKMKRQIMHSWLSAPYVGSIGTSSEHSVDPDLRFQGVPHGSDELECYDERELGEDHPLKNMVDRGIFESGSLGHMIGNKDHEDFEDSMGVWIFGNMKLGVKGLTKDLVAAMLSIVDPSAGQEAPSVTQPQPSSTMLGYIRAKLEANAELKESVLGKDLTVEDYAKRMVELINQRRNHLLQTKTAKKRKFDDEGTQPTEEKIEEDKDDKPTKKTGKRRKHIARKGFHTDHDKDESEDSDEANEKDNSTSGTKNSLLISFCATKSPSIANYKIIKQGRKGVYQIVRENGTDMVYISFGAMLTDISRDDLTELYRIVMKKHGMNEPEDEFEKVLWEYLKNMFEEPLSTDLIWSLPGQQRIICWRYYDACRVHCLNLESADVYMLIERKYHLSAEVCKAMLDKKLQGGKQYVDCYYLLIMQVASLSNSHMDWLSISKWLCPRANGYLVKATSNPIDSWRKRAEEVEQRIQFHRRHRVKMDNPNITMKEYIRLEEEKARRRAIVFNDTLTSEATLTCEPTVSSLNNDEIDFRVSFDESDDEDCTVIFNKNSFSYKIISVNNLKIDLENDNDKVDMPSFPPPEPTVSCFDDLYFFKDFENEFPAIVYNDAQTSKSDLLTEPMLNPQHIDEFNLKYETSLSEYNEEEQNIICFNDLFPFSVIYPDELKMNTDNDNDKVDIENSLEDLSVKPLPDLINTDVGAYAHGSNKLLETCHDTSNKFFKTKTFIK